MGLLYLDGFVVGAKENKLGIRGSDTHTLLFNDVKVPKENRIGEEGFGFKFAMKTLTGGRIGIASQALGIASGSLELATAYAKERKTFGKPIHEHQAIQFKLAEMATKIETARLLCLKAASLLFAVASCVSLTFSLIGHGKAFLSSLPC